jgi:hypothetical protein
LQYEFYQNVIKTSISPAAYVLLKSEKYNDFTKAFISLKLDIQILNVTSKRISSFTDIKTLQLTKAIINLITILETKRSFIVENKATDRQQLIKEKKIQTTSGTVSLTLL